MKRPKPKRDMKYIEERFQEVEKLYKILIDEFAVATIEKKIDDEAKMSFFRRWDKIALNWNHWHQVGNVGHKRLTNPFKVKYLELRKIYNNLKKSE